MATDPDGAAETPRKPRPADLPGLEAPSLSWVEILERYFRAPLYYQRASHVRLLVDGRQAYPEMLAAIDSAASAVDLETYIFQADRTGTRFAEALKRAAARGVRARLLLDWVGCLSLPNGFVRELMDAGVAVRVYHPLILTRPSWAVNRRNHRKILVVDGRASFTGGLNVADDYASVEDGGRGWRDTHVRIDGVEPAALLSQLFRSDWRASVRADARRGVPFAAMRQRRRRRRLRGRLRRMLRRFRGRRFRKSPPAKAPQGVVVQILGNHEFRLRRRIQRAYLHAIRNARQYVLIENAYFIPDGRFRRALARAVRRGAVVAVAVARHSDVTLAALAGKHLYRELLKAGVKFFEWPEGMMHAKTAVIDDAWSIVGSYNFDHRSLMHQLEAVAVIADAAFARRLRDQQLLDLSRCEELTLRQHDARPMLQKLAECCAYLFRYWL